MVKRSLVLIAVCSLWLGARPVSAQGYVTPFVGSPFNTGAPAGAIYGVSAGAMSSGLLGGEVEFADSPKFFSEGPGPRRVLTLTGNVLVGLPLGAFRPYGTAGLGLIRQHRTMSVGGVFDDVTDNDLGYSFGGGVNIRFGDGFGLRTDFRRFQVNKTDGFAFNRLFFGVTFGSAG